jgi:hypothetical protein
MVASMPSPATGPAASPKRRAAASLAPVAVLGAAAIAFYWKVLLAPGEYVIPWDFRYYHYTLASLMARAFAGGELPLWDPFTYCGFPIYANLTLGLFYPPMAATVLLSNLAGGGHLLYALELQLMAHVWLAGAFTWLLLRKLGVSRAAALAGGLAYQCGCFFASQNQHLGAISAAAWLPLAWFAVIALTGRFSLRWAAVLAFALAMSLLAGFPAVTGPVYASTAALAAVLAITRRAGWRVLARIAPSLAWSLLLAAVQLIPTMQLTRLGVARFRYEFAGTGGGVPWQALATLVWPNYWGVFDFDPAAWKLPWNPTFLYLYGGLTALLLAIRVLWPPRNRYAVPLAAMAAFFGLWMLGDKTPVGRLLFPLLPQVLRGSLYLEFAMPVFSLAFALLAGLGADALLARRGRALRFALVAVVALDLVLTGAGRRINTASLGQEPGIDYDRFGGSTRLPGAIRTLTAASRPPSRIDVKDAPVFWAGHAPIFEIPTANGNDPFALTRLMQFRLSFTKGERWGRYYEVGDTASPLLGLMNVEWLTSSRGVDPASLGPAWVKALELDGQYVYRNTAVLPRFFLASEIRPAVSPEQALAIVRAPGFDPRRAAAVEGFASPALLAEGTVRVIRYSAGRVLLETEAAGASFLGTSEAWYPGWEARVDGRPAPLYPTNAAFRGLPLPPGLHRVEMSFSPGVLYSGALLSAAAWLALALGGIFGGPRRALR